MTKSIAAYKNFRHLTVRDVVRAARANDFHPLDSDVFEAAIEAERLREAGVAIVTGWQRDEIHGAPEMLNWMLRDLSRSMHAEAASHDAFCRDAYGS